MKAVILAAGKGSRISRLTNGRPKSLLPFGGETLLGHSLRLIQQAGIDEVIIVTGYRRDDIIAYVEKNWSRKATFVFNPHFANTNVLYSFWLSIPYIGNYDFIFLHADTVFSEEVLTRLLASTLGKEAVFAVDAHPCDDESMKVMVKNGAITQVSKQMPNADAFGEFLGVAWLQGATLPRIREQAEKLFAEEAFLSFFEHGIQELIDAGKITVNYCDVSGLPWREVDFEQDYLAAQDLFHGQS